MSRCYIAYIPNAGLTKAMRVVKIGHSRNPSDRFQQLCAMGWLTPGWIEATDRHSEGALIEKFMHDRLRLERVHHEWFHVEDEKLGLVKQEVEARFGVVWVLDDISDRDCWEQEQAA